MSIFVSTLIIAVLLVPTSMPTAISVSIEGLEGQSIAKGETFEFYIDVPIETDERLPIAKVRLIVMFPNGTSKSYEFPIGGGISAYIHLDEPVSIIDTTSYGYTHRYGYGSFYGYGYISGYGYGYYQDGYGYGFYGPQKLRWKATLINTEDLPKGSYRVRVEVESDGVWWGGAPTETTFTITAPPPTPPVKTVLIDIKPGSYPNSINPGSKGRIPVAILTNETFDATTVDPATVRFGPAGAKAVHSAIEDVDHDGDLDVILHFKTQETGIKPGDTEATLTGKTYDGISIKGTDTIRTVPPEWAAKYRKEEDEREEHQMGEGQKGEDHRGEDERGEDEEGQDRGGKDQKGQQNKKDNEPPKGLKGNPGKGKNNPH
ncbi:MAG: hypothetical protein ACETWE_10210 [Candidatus Bathyarchaeia archaeon]